jgi:DNA-binding NarL/FixJ family response regulator
VTIRILVGDDHPILRAGLRALLNAEPGLEVVGEAADGHEVLRRAVELRPDVVLLDVSMPGLDGIEVTRRLKGMMPGIRVLVLTIYNTNEVLGEAIRAGAAGYVVQIAPASDLVNAIHTVVAGDRYIHPAVADPAEARPSSAGGVGAGEVGQILTPREIDILRLIAQGYNSQQIAGKLNISKRTVRNHQTNLADKLGLHNRVELALYAKEHGLV